MTAPLIAAALAMTGCASSGDAAGGTSRPASPAPSATTPPAEPFVSSEIVGYWHRAQSCQELLTAFQTAGLAESHAGWLQGNFFGGREGPSSGDLCAGAEGPLEHSHWFTDDGEFGSHDQEGATVDGGDYALADSDTVTFPSHSAEFGYSGDIAVDFTVDEGIATFTVNIPDLCDASCQDAHAWALSAFASGPWAAGDVP